MNLNKAIIISICILIFGGGVIMYQFLTEIEEFGQPVTRIIEIASQDEKESIYIKLKSWGTTGDHQVIVICQNPDENFTPDPSKEYIFEGLVPFFYQQEYDTLRVFVKKKSQIPEKFESILIVEQIELSNPELMSLYHDYKEKGLRKISN